MYHDVPEILVGDTPLMPGVLRVDKKEKEMVAAKMLKDQLPVFLGGKFFDLFQEFEDQKTMESKFARAVDVLDAQIHEMDYKDDWKGWSEKFLVDKKAHLFKEFPELERDFFELVDFLRVNGYFDVV